MNEENLKSLGNRTTSEQREIAKKGGQASGRARRLKAGVRAHLQELLLLPVSDVEAMSNAEGIAAALVNQAMAGNVRAITEILRLTDRVSIGLRGNLADKAGQVIRAVTQGDLPLESGQGILTMLQTQAKITEVAELQKQVAELASTLESIQANMHFGGRQ